MTIRYDAIVLSLDRDLCVEERGRGGERGVGDLRAGRSGGLTRRD